MDFLMINSVNSYVKNMNLQNKWKMKKDTNDFSKCTLNELQRKNERFKQSYLEKKDDEKDKETLTSIYNKIYSGAKLTPDEMKYLQVKNPEMYKKLKDLEHEKKQYERELKQCRTKEDVEKLKFSKVASSLSAINAVKNNPNIPEGFKLGVAMQEQRRLNELEKIAAKFVKSEDYHNLPTEAEKAKAEKDLAEAQKAERDEAVSSDVESDKTEKTADTKNDDNTEKTVRSESSKSSEAKPADSDKTIIDEKEMSRIEAESTNEARKVKRSKAKCAYEKSALNFLTEQPTVIVKG